MAGSSEPAFSFLAQTFWHKKCYPQRFISVEDPPPTETDLLLLTTKEVGVFPTEIRA